ncbi:MAG: hypothetical protein H7345_16590 [Rubritepida sp.]|nr:hypothetical protein [Rubritepida sp.]
MPAGFWRRYLALTAGANLAWEAAQLPLYSIWQTATPGELAFAILHCTGGDVMIAGAALALALLALPPSRRQGRGLVIAATGLGLLYTVFSEWMNVEWRASWTYAPAMPRLSPFGTGVSPFLQWLLLPPLCLIATRTILRGATR